MQPKTILLAAMSLDLGGAETHVVSLAEELKRRGHLVTVTSQGGRLVEHLSSAGIPHFSLPLHSRSPLRLMQSVGMMAELLELGGVQLIHAHARIPAWVSELARWRRRLPLVTTYHGVYNAGFPWRWFSRWGDRVIAVSEDVKRHLVENFSVLEEQVVVIPNGIDTTRFSPDVDCSAIRAEFPQLSQAPRIVHVSRLSGPFAGVALRLVEASNSILEGYPQGTVLIVGDGDRLPEVRAAAESVNRQAGREMVLVVGGRTETPGFFSLAHLVVGVARVALEAMASGRAVLIAGEGGYQGLIEPQRMDELRRANFTARGSDQPVDASRLAADVRAALADPGRLAELGRIGRQFVLNHFSIGHMTDEISKVYEQVLGGR